MTQQQFIITVEVDQDTYFSLEDLAVACGTASAWLQELVAYGVLEPQRGTTPATWQFDLNQLRRARRATRLYHDLEVNYAGIALVLELLDQVETLRAEADILHKHFRG